MPYWLMALLATLGTWAVTALGAAVVLFFRNPKERTLRVMLGFAAGVMLAASVWSLLEPAMAQATQLLHMPGWPLAVSGCLCGVVFLWAADRLIAHFKPDGSARSARMLVFSITLHNIPEGLAVGVAFGMLAVNPTRETFLSACSVAVGIAVQNFPEGAAVSLPLQKAGFSRKRSFFWGQLSGVVEPIAGVFGALMAMVATYSLPFLLSFAAGAMLLVSLHELIPACHTAGEEERSYLPTAGMLLGFLLMMVLENL
ncbi:MAG: ZIP family metal transporter [Oscillospiraceae bacterium]|jgi:ZIP family zinc transporter|nr:ZIP family metal transporter [Oscillospiraceae bacterium]